MADKPSQIEPAAEFQKLPLEMILATPLVAVAKAQAIAGQATLDFVNGLCDPQGKAKTIDLSIEKKEGDATKSTLVKVPLLTVVPIPHLLIDSLTVNFKYEISQTFRSKSDTSASAKLEVATGGALSAFVQATFQGNVGHSSSSEATTNRGGTLEIMMRASQAPIPVGLDRLLTMLSQSIVETDRPA